MSQRIRQFLLVASMSWLSWLAMMLVHEFGHVVGAICTGGTVRRLVWYPTALSRTDVSPNPHPIVEIGSGPALGCLMPLLFAGCAISLRLRFTYLVLFFAGFCLISNGGYIGVGSFWPVGDARELLRLGMPRSTLALFAALTLIAGFWILHQVSPRFGFGKTPVPIIREHLYFTALAAALLTTISFMLGQSGL